MTSSDCLCKGRKCGRCRLIELARARAEAQAAQGGPPKPPPGDPLQRF
jgi:hypothetical protein